MGAFIHSNGTSDSLVRRFFVAAVATAAIDEDEEEDEATDTRAGVEAADVANDGTLPPLLPSVGADAAESVDD